MNEFVTWSMLTAYATFVSIILVIVNFTKELPYIKKIPTKYYSFFISFISLILVNVYFGKFSVPDLFVYAITSIFVSTNANGIADFNTSNKNTDSKSTIMETKINETK